MCCAHSYDIQVCPIILGQSLETRVRQKSDRGRRRRGQRGVRKDKELVGYEQSNRIQVTQRNTIIRLVCIKGDTEFEYKRFGKQGAEAEEDIGEQWGAIR